MKSHYTAQEIINLFETRIQRYNDNTHSQITAETRESIINSNLMAFAKAAYLGEPVRIVEQDMGQRKLRQVEISSLLVTGKECKVFYPKKGTEVDGHRYMPRGWNKGSYEEYSLKAYCFAPSNILYPFDAMAFAKSFPGKAKICKDGRGKIEVNNDTNLQEYIAVVPFVLDSNATCDVADITLTVTLKDRPLEDADVVIFDYSKFTEVLGFNPYEAIESKSDQFVFINLMLEYMNRHNAPNEVVSDPSTITSSLDGRDSDGNFYRVYWERYKDQYYQSCFIIVTEQRKDVSRDVSLTSGSNPYSGTTYITDTDYNSAVTPGGIQVQIDSNIMSNVVQTGNVGFTIGRFKQLSRSRIVFDTIDFSDPFNPNNPGSVPDGYTPDLTAGNIAVDIVGQDVLKQFYQGLLNPLRDKTKKIPAIYTEGYFELHTDSAYIIDRVYVDYIRLPRLLNSRFDISPDLDMAAMETVINMAVADFLEIVQSRRQPTTLKAAQRNNDIQQ